MISFYFSIFLAAGKNVKFPVYLKLFTISGKVLSIKETMDTILGSNYEGIKRLNIIDFLLSDEI